MKANPLLQGKTKTEYEPIKELVMRINLQRLEELKRELHTDGQPDYENQEPMGLQVVMDALRQYVYDEGNDIITKLLIDQGVLVSEEEEASPIVKPHKFNVDA